MENPFETIIARLEAVEKLLLELKQEKKHEPTTDNSKLKTQKQLLKELSISLPTLLDWRKKGLIQAYRIGSRIFYKSEEIEKALLKK